jgi:disulfide bond formation protein DsbB
MNFASFLNTSLAWLTVLSEVISLIIILALIFSPRKNAIPTNWIQKKSLVISNLARKYALHVVFIVSLVAMAGSLSYSDILGYTPCVMCWYQRIAMYPLVLLSGIGLLMKDRKILIYILSLSIIGAGLALYHYLLQLGLFPAPCTTTGYSVSCAEKFVLRLGYITIPMMALSAFILNAIVSWIGYFAGNNRVDQA